MAVYQSQLGNVIRVLDVEEDSVIATSTEMGSVRAFIFNQTTDNISVTFPDPVPTSEKIITVVNRGTTNLKVQNVFIAPGPAYGFFWDGAAYQPTMVDGVGMVSNLEETTTVKFTGNGEETTPLQADVKVSEEVDNTLEVRADGLFVTASGTNIGTGGITWVDGSIGDDINGVGTLSKPYKTFTKAMSVASITGEDTIVILPGDYVEDFSIIRKINVEGLIEGNKVVRFIGSGTNLPDIDGISIKNIAIHNEDPTPAFEVSGFGDGVVFTNVKLSNSDSTTTVLRLSGDNKGTLRFSDSVIFGQISVVDDIQNAVHRLVLDQVTGITKVTLDSSNSTLLAQNIDAIGHFEHVKGNLYLKNIGNVVPEVNGRAIISEATFNDGYLGLKSVTLRQLDGSFAAIDKSGDCNYYLDDVSRSLANLGFAINGSKLLSNQAADINAGIVADNYVPIGPSVAGHLAGIDDKLANVLEEVVITDTSTIETLGTGTTSDPFQPSLKISADPKNTIEISPDGVLVKSSAEISKGVTHFVDITIGNDVDNDGTLGAPFKTINKALEVVSKYDLVKVFPGDYVEDLLLDEERFEGVLIEGFGIIDGAVVRVLGQVLLDGIDITRSRLKDIAIVGSTSGVPTVTIQNTAGRFKWENVSITHEDGEDEVVVEITGDNQNWFEFNRCGFSGKINLLSAAQQTPIFVNLIEPYAEPQINLDCTPATVTVLNAGLIKAPVHTKGTLFLDGVSRIEAVSGVCLTSTANLGQGILGLKNVSMFQANGTFGAIEKTGTCPFLLANVVRDFTSDVLTGPVLLKTHAADYNGNYTPTNYDVTGENIPAHLEGIDKKVSRYVEAVLNYQGGWADSEILLSWPVRQPFTIPPNVEDTIVDIINPEVGIDSTIILRKRTSANVVTEIGRIHFNNGAINLSGSGSLMEEGDTLVLITENGATFSLVAINLLAGKV